MSDDLTEKLIENEKVLEEEGKESEEDYNPNRVWFAPVVRASDVEFPLDGHKTDSTSKNKSNDMGKTRFGPSKKVYRLPRGFWQSRREKDKAISEKEEETNCCGKWSMDNVKEDKTSSCRDKCTIVGGKKTKRRRYTRKYTKKYRSRKSRRSKKGSKNNKKKNFI